MSSPLSSSSLLTACQGIQRLLQRMALSRQAPQALLSLQLPAAGAAHAAAQSPGLAWSSPLPPANAGTDSGVSSMEGAGALCMKASLGKSAAVEQSSAARTGPLARHKSHKRRAAEAARYCDGPSGYGLALQQAYSSNSCLQPAGWNHRSLATQAGHPPPHHQAHMEQGAGGSSQSDREKLGTASNPTVTPSGAARGSTSTKGPRRPHKTAMAPATARPGSSAMPATAPGTSGQQEPDTLGQQEARQRQQQQQQQQQGPSGQQEAWQQQRQPPPPPPQRQQQQQQQQQQWRRQQQQQWRWQQQQLQRQRPAWAPPAPHRLQATLPGKAAAQRGCAGPATGTQIPDADQRAAQKPRPSTPAGPQVSGLGSSAGGVHLGGQLEATNGRKPAGEQQAGDQVEVTRGGKPAAEQRAAEKLRPSTAAGAEMWSSAGKQQAGAQPEVTHGRKPAGEQHAAGQPEVTRTAKPAAREPQPEGQQRSDPNAPPSPAPKPAPSPSPSPSPDPTPAPPALSFSPSAFAILPPSSLQSVRRAAAEHEARAAGLSNSSPAPSRGVRGCDAACPCSAAGWCQFPVSLPLVDWQTTVQANPSTYSMYNIGHGYHKYALGQGLQVLYVADARWAPDAVNQLRQSMQDPVLAIDLEWKPEFHKGTNHKVALMQISSATLCVLLHTACMGFKLPPAVQALLADPQVHVVGFDWGSADEQKLQASFGCGKNDFGHFYDLQQLSRELGWVAPTLGLDKLAQRVLGFGLNKSKKISCSNWAQPRLTGSQIKYAAMDAFSTGQVFRGLRLWHSDPAPCPGCKVPLGAARPYHLVCRASGQVFQDIFAYQRHCKKTEQESNVFMCGECGRMVSGSSTTATASGEGATATVTTTLTSLAACDEAEQQANEKQQDVKAQAQQRQQKRLAEEWQR